jgi:hypothetical protein
MRLVGKRIKPRPAWQYDARGIIWRVLCTTTGKLVGEDRDTGKKTVAFFCLDQSTGRVMWDQKSYSEQWWIGLNSVHQDVLFLHKFASPDLPEHKSILAIDLMSGNMLWSNDELRFISAEGTTVRAGRGEPAGVQFFDVDYRTGELVRTWTDGEQPSPDPSAERAEEGQPVFPTPLELLHAQHSPTTDLVQQYYDTALMEGSTEVVEGENTLVVGHYRRTDPQHVGSPLEHSIGIIDKSSGELIFEEITDHRMAAVVPDSFFIQGTMLFYVKERSSLTAVALPSVSKP